MDFALNEVEARVFGALLEKGMATPEYYPLTLNGLLNACNQKSNREPVVIYDEETVARAIATLKVKQLVVQSDSGRATKYAECFVAKAKLINREAALLCLLLLRGPQTVGELRGRAERLYQFGDLAEVATTLENLVELGLVTKQARQPGRKEARFMHRLLAAGLDEGGGAGPGPNLAAAACSTPVTVSDRLAQLEEEVAVLQGELADLRRELLLFKGQFD